MNKVNQALECSALHRNAVSAGRKLRFVQDNIDQLSESQANNFVAKYGLLP